MKIKNIVLVSITVLALAVSQRHILAESEDDEDERERETIEREDVPVTTNQSAPATPAAPVVDTNQAVAPVVTPPTVIMPTLKDFSKVHDDNQNGIVDDYEALNP